MRGDNDGVADDERSLDLFTRVFLTSRRPDSYINATDICDAYQKSVQDYLSRPNTKSFLDVLALDVGIPQSDLVKGSDSEGWFVHPYLAVDLSRWADPAFGFSVIQWFLKPERKRHATKLFLKVFNNVFLL